MKKIAIIGAGGHGKVAADIARLNGYDNIVFLDDNPNAKECNGYHIIGKVSDIETLDCPAIVAIGNEKARKQVMSMLEDKEIEIVTLIHPSAIIGEKVEIGKGSVIAAGAIVNPAVVIGEGCIINTCSSVDHDCRLGNYVHISVGSHLSGNVSVGEATKIGPGVVIDHNIHIAEECNIGAGVVVVDDIKENATFVKISSKEL